jgi:8-oxo-dGTP pyrophosphatase MutT (NUDIX family)
MGKLMTGPSAFPVSVKGILFLGDRIPLLLNERDEWELPGGRLESSDVSPEACVCRELKEELGCEGQVKRLVDCWLYQVLPSRFVFIVTYLCITAQSEKSLKLSHEHKELGIFKISGISKLNIPSGYVRSIQLAWDYEIGSRPR